MEQAIIDEYYRLRSLGFNAHNALKAARSNVEFKKLELMGVVKFEVVPDESLYDDSYVDDWTDMTESQRAAKKREIWAMIENEGVWQILAQTRCPCCGQWIIVDTVSGFVGDSYTDSGYDSDVRFSAISLYNTITCMTSSN